MAHLCVPQNQALGVCRGFVPVIQICGTHGRKDLVNATIISNVKEEEPPTAIVFSVRLTNTIVKKTKVSQGDTKKISQRTIKTRQLITLKIIKLRNPHPHTTN